jgi:hypothetical protein
MITERRGVNWQSEKLATAWVFHFSSLGYVSFIVLAKKEEDIRVPFFQNLDSEVCMLGNALHQGTTRRLLSFFLLLPLLLFGRLQRAVAATTID